MAMVLIKHPDLPPAAPGKVSAEAYETIFKEKGFIVVDDNGEPAEVSEQASEETGTPVAKRRASAKEVAQ